MYLPEPCIWSACSNEAIRLTPAVLYHHTATLHWRVTHCSILINVYIKGWKGLLQTPQKSLRLKDILCYSFHTCSYVKCDLQHAARHRNLSPYFLCIHVHVQCMWSSLICLWWGRDRRTCISTAMDSVMDSSWLLSTIFTAYSRPLSFDTHFLTVLEKPL